MKPRELNCHKESRRPESTITEKVDHQGMAGFLFPVLCCRFCDWRRGRRTFRVQCTIDDQGRCLLIVRGNLSWRQGNPNLPRVLRPRK